MSNDALEEFQSEGADDTSTLTEDAGEPQLVPSNPEEDSEITQSDLEDNQNMNQIFEWIEAKLGLLRLLGKDQEGVDEANENGEDSAKDKSAQLEEILEDIKKITSKESTENPDSTSEDITKMLDMLQDTTLGLLEQVNLSEKRCRSIKVLYTLIQHLAASVGTKVTLEDIQKHINGNRVLDLYSEVQNSRESLFLKVETLKRNIEHCVNKSKYISEETREHESKVEVFFSEYFTLTDVQDVNKKLRALTKKSERFLIEYSDSIGYLATKAKTFFTLKQDLERPLIVFMTKEIPDLYKTQI